MKLSYKGKSAIITGASGGMGLEISKKLSQNNISVLMLDLKKPSNDFLKKNLNCDFKKVDVTNLKSMKNHIDKFYKKNSPSDIKVVFNSNDEVMYLSRNDIPSFSRSQFTYMYKAYHVVPFKKDFLTTYMNLPPSKLELVEFNEYLRILDHGHKIKIQEVESSAISVDTKSDLLAVRKAMRSDLYLSLYCDNY